MTPAPPAPSLCLRFVHNRTARVSLIKTIECHRFCLVMGALLTLLAGVVLLQLPFGGPWVNASYNLPSLFAPGVAPENVGIIGLDEQTCDAWGISPDHWSRTLHARLIDHLHADHARLIVVDLQLLGTNAPEEDAALVASLSRAQPVVLDAVRIAKPDPNFPGIMTLRPTNFLGPGIEWGIGAVQIEGDLPARRLYTGTDDDPSLAWTAARLSGATLPDSNSANQATYWLRYYGPPGTLPYVSYHKATNQPAGYYSNQVVFIGGNRSLGFLNEKLDRFYTPFTAWSRHAESISGVELVATMYLNLVRHDYLRRMPWWGEFLLLLGSAVLFGAGLALLRPLPALGWAVAAMLAVSLVGLLGFCFTNLWWAWGVVAGGQIPCALAWSVLYRTHRLTRTTTATWVMPARPTPTIALESGPGLVGVPTGIPEHTLVKRIGAGAYGEVWLARDVVGAYHAVKLVHLARFDRNPEPFEREYRGISAYSPISLSHPGLLHVLLVGRRDQEGYFYYVMELGDDAKTGSTIDPVTYEPRNLDQDLQIRQRLPVAECIEIILQLAPALDHLHRHGLIHRDIKPSNIVFVEGVPKLADIGLVTKLAATDHHVTYVGTEGYIPPEGPGTILADLYSLGVVLYRMSMGLNAKQLPALPNSLHDRPDARDLLQLNQIISTACAPEAAKRYPSAAALHQALLELKDRLTVP